MVDAALDLAAQGVIAVDIEKRRLAGAGCGSTRPIAVRCCRQPSTV
jgi:hypothetical protein